MRCETLGVALKMNSANVTTVDGLTASCAGTSVREVVRFVESRVNEFECSRVALCCDAEKLSDLVWLTDAMTAIANANLDSVVVWQTSGEFVDVATACEFPDLLQSSGLHVLASWASRASANGSIVLARISQSVASVMPVDRGVPQVDHLSDCAIDAASELSISIENAAVQLSRPVVVFSADRDSFAISQRCIEMTELQYETIDLARVVPIPETVGVMAYAAATLHSEQLI